MSFKVSPIGICAAEITGLDCAHDLTDDAFVAVRETYRAFPVLVFRDQSLAPPQLAAFGRRFGKLEGYGSPPPASGSATEKPAVAALHETKPRATPDQMLYVSPEDSDVLIMTNEVREGLAPVGIVDNAEMWHSDASHKSEPCASIIVHVVRNPADGGDTEFCDMRAVYDALTPQIKAVLDGRNAAHHWSKSRNLRFVNTLDPSAWVEGERIAQAIPEVMQPIVRTHPETGRSGLYVSPRFTLRIEGLAPEHSSGILNGLFTLADESRFHYRHEWRPNDVTIWDNRCVNHRVRGYPAQDVRCRYRVTVAGDRPFFRQRSVHAA